jgi:hypothetical protein
MSEFCCASDTLPLGRGSIALGFVQMRSKGIGMRIAFRTALGLMVFGAVTASAMQIDHDWAATTAESLFNLPHDYVWFQESQGKQTRLEVSFDELQVRIQRKDQIIRAVVQQRLSLRAAVKEFLAASQDCWYDWDYQASTHPDWSRQKRCAQIIVESVALMMLDDNQISVEMTQALDTALREWADD